ncbi:organic cation transporter protein-like [Ptychodera flava]|uniref:organic cation transporter protein-like n=1 Tax=Ptychodera flava TaxID=63121 RepID=UPI00396A71D7
MAQTKKGSTLEYDNVLKYVLGEFGPYQAMCFCFLALTAIPSGMIAFSVVFTLAETDSWCKVPDVHRISQQICSANFSEDCQGFVKNLTTPLEMSHDPCGVAWKHSQCYRYNVTADDVIHYSASSAKEEWATKKDLIKCDQGWEYDKSQYKLTISQQFNLVCDRYHYNALLSSISFAGSLIGSFVFGMFLDRYGRLRGLMLSVVLLQAFGITTVFSPDFTFYAAFHLLLFIAVYAVYLSGFVLATEHVGPSKRTTAGMVVAMFYSVGYMLLALMAYNIRVWWKLQLAITIPHTIFLAYWLFIPESPRWLLSMGKVEEAEKIIRRSAKVNKVEIPSDLFEESWKPGLKDVEQDSMTDEETKTRMLDLVKLPNMRKKTLILAFNYLANSMVYFGLSLSTSSLGGSDYLNAFISAAVEIPGYGLPIFLMDSPRLGRRWCLFGSMILSGCGCIATVLVPVCGNLSWLRVTLAMIGKFGISASFGIVYVYSAELFPTPVRSFGIGICATCSNFGAILSPQILLLKTLWRPLPIIIFGILAIIAGILVLPLPETRGMKLPETMAEGERFGKKRNKNQYPGYGEIRKIELNDYYYYPENGVKAPLAEF